MMLLLEIKLIKNDVIIGDNIDMRMMLLLMMMWHEMILMSVMSLRWYDVDVENDIEMRWWWCW